MRTPSMFDLDGYRLASLDEVKPMLDELHYLGAATRGKAFAQFQNGMMVACMVWGPPTSRHLPNDGTWLELSRWCLTPEAGPNAGSRMHRQWIRHTKQHLPHVTVLVSYSDRSAGHTGALYRACNWSPAPTWHRLRPPPTGGGTWDGITKQEPKDRWVFIVRPDPRTGALLRVNDTSLNPGLTPWQQHLKPV